MMAGLLYLPKFVYHSEAYHNLKTVFKTMELLLYHDAGHVVILVVWHVINP